uniref:Uncharacterized protein n=1 Tax=Lotus japonicus TaxID=34305 RepID=I3SY28_LOTJA|nr:unknown [Lotus japonicus]
MRPVCAALPMKSRVLSLIHQLCRSLDWTWRMNRSPHFMMLLAKLVRFWGNWMLLSTVLLTKGSCKSILRQMRVSSER